MKFLNDELNYFFSGKGMPYEKVAIMVAVVVTLLFSALLSHNYIQKGEIVVIDVDNSKTSRTLVETMNASPYIKVKAVLNMPTEPQKLLQQDACLAVIYIPAGFEKNRYEQSAASVGVFYDNITSAPTANLKSALNGIVGMENAKMTAITRAAQGLPPASGGISLKERLLFNPNGSASNSTIVGFLFFFGSMFFVFASIGMTARLRLERKWQEQILTGTPFDLIVRTLPYCICLFVSFFVGMGILRVIGDLSFTGSLITFIAALVLYILALTMVCILFGWSALDPGKAISKMILFLPGGFILGGYTMPVDIMPSWMIWLSHAFPLTWLFHFTRDLMLRGAGFSDIAREFGGLMLYTGTLAGLLCNVFYRERKKLQQAEKEENLIAGAVKTS